MIFNVQHNLHLWWLKNVNIDKCQVKLKPIEQLILVIPPKFYSFVMNENILNKILTDKNFIKIKHLFPNNFDIDKTGYLTRDDLKSI